MDELFAFLIGLVLIVATAVYFSSDTAEQYVDGLYWDHWASDADWDERQKALALKYEIKGGTRNWALQRCHEIYTSAAYVDKCIYEAEAEYKAAFE